MKERGKGKEIDFQWMHSISKHAKDFADSMSAGKSEVVDYYNGGGTGDKCNEESKEARARKTGKHHGPSMGTSSTPPQSVGAVRG